jgi:hypothetical protein
MSSLALKLIGIPLVGILTALAAVVFEQLLAILANLFLHREVLPEVHTSLGFFLVAATVIEESCKYLALSRVLRRSFGLTGSRFIFSALTTGLFFGLTEIYFVLLSGGKKISEIGNLDSQTFFSLLTVIAVHILTIFFMSLLIASQREKTKFEILKTIAPPIFFHLLVNFLIIQRGDFTDWLVEIVLGIFFTVSLAIMAVNFRHLD